MTTLKVGDIVRFKSKESLKGVSMWYEPIREDLPMEFKITGIVNGFDGTQILGHNTQYNISDKMLDLVGGTSVVEFKAGDRVRFKSLSECKKIGNWNSEMNYLAGKEFTIAGIRDTSSYSATQIIIPVKVFEGTVWSINNRMIEHIPVKEEDEFKVGDRVRFKSIEELGNLRFISNGIYKFAGKEFTIAATGVAYTPYSEIKFEIVPKEEGYTGYFIYDTMIEHIPKESAMDKIIKSFTSIVSQRPEYHPYPQISIDDFNKKYFGMSISTPYIGIDPVAKNKISGYPVICDECEEEEVYIAKRRISFSKIQ